MSELSFTVPAMTCGHCTAAVHDEIAKIDGVSGVIVDLDSKAVRVTGEHLDRDAIWAAVEEAGFEAVA
jgi:copper chaperone